MIIGSIILFCILGIILWIVAEVTDGFESANGTISNETKYLAYEYEKELVEELKQYIGKKVKITYGHDGGYIGWNSCGTYHIKSIELLEEN